MGKPRLTTSLTAASLAGLLILADTAGAAMTYRTVALTGDPAPGADPGVNFLDFGSPVLNGAGQTAFLGRLTGAGVNTKNDNGLWSEGGGSGLALVAREGSQAPGTEPGVKFSGLFNSAPVLNADGAVAFRGFLTGTGVNASNDGGIWATDPAGVLTLIAREGDPSMSTTTH